MNLLSRPSLSKAYLFLVVAAAVALLLSLQAPSAEGAQRYKAMLSVSGGVTITSQRDFLTDCQPGQAWTLTEDADVDIRGKVVIERQGAKLLSSTAASSSGGAASKNKLISYEESNFCAPDEPIELEQPNCQSITGKGVATLQPDGHGIKPWRVSVGIARKTGGSQNGDCMGPGIDRPTPKGTLINPLDTIYSDIVLPLGLKVASFKTLGVGKRLIRTVRIGGSCDAAVVYRGPRISKAADGDCEVEGVFNVLVKRLTKSASHGVSIASIP